MSRIVILGATGTIGSTLARRLAASNRELLLVGRSHEKLASLSNELKQPMVLWERVDSHLLEEKFRSLFSETAGFSAVVNCIGSLLLKPAHATSDVEFQQTLETNLGSAFAAVRLGALILRPLGGSIVLFASAAAEIGIMNHEAIAAAKGGVIGLARSAASTYSTANIRVNVISPGLVRTELTRRIWSNPVSEKGSLQLHPLGRLGEPNHIASLAAWLLDPENDWITGQVIGLDGGLGHVLPRK